MTSAQARLHSSARNGAVCLHQKSIQKREPDQAPGTSTVPDSLHGRFLMTCTASHRMISHLQPCRRHIQ